MRILILALILTLTAGSVFSKPKLKPIGKPQTVSRCFKLWETPKTNKYYIYNRNNSTYFNLIRFSI